MQAVESSLLFLDSVLQAVNYYKQYGFVEIELDSTPQKAVSMIVDLLDQDI